MKIKRIVQLLDTDREVHGKGFVSIRPVLKSDGLGFSIHKTIIPVGEPLHWHYRNHLEACYCIKGRGILKDLDTGMEHLITPDVVYLLDKHDNHTFHALEDTVLISVFNPPCSGDEVHDEDGNYELKANGLHQLWDK